MSTFTAMQVLEEVKQRHSQFSTLTRKTEHDASTGLLRSEVTLKLGPCIFSGMGVDSNKKVSLQFAAHQVLHKLKDVQGVLFPRDRERLASLKKIKRTPVPPSLGASAKDPPLVDPRLTADPVVSSKITPPPVPPLMSTVGPIDPRLRSDAGVYLPPDLLAHPSLKDPRLRSTRLPPSKTTSSPPPPPVSPLMSLATVGPIDPRRRSDAAVSRPPHLFAQDFTVDNFSTSVTSSPIQPPLPSSPEATPKRPAPAPRKPSKAQQLRKQVEEEAPQPLGRSPPKRPSRSSDRNPADTPTPPSPQKRKKRSVQRGKDDASTPPSPPKSKKRSVQRGKDKELHQLYDAQLEMNFDTGNALRSVRCTRSGALLRDDIEKSPVNINQKERVTEEPVEPTPMKRRREEHFFERSHPNIMGPRDVMVNPRLRKIKIEEDYIPPALIVKTEPVEPIPIPLDPQIVVKVEPIATEEIVVKIEPETLFEYQEEREEGELSA